MARKGNKKVRTGCVTCKSRKVKCDETKPLCNRCTSTGRQCDGYAAQPPAARDPSFEMLLQSQRPHHPFGAVTSKDEGRALHYFHAAAGPLLSGGNDGSFWTRIVMQFTQFEPAVRHSVIAISLLYEQMHEDKEVGVSVPKIKDELTPLKHYNLAIRELKSMDAVEKRPVVLFVCILFICIELLQANRDIALQHCRHGLALLSQVVYQYPWTQEHLIPLFKKLSSFLYHVGNETSAYSVLDAFASPRYKNFGCFDDAQRSMQEIFRRMLRLVKMGDEYRVGSSRDKPVAEHLLAEQETINMVLDDWNRLFAAFHDQTATANAMIQVLDLSTQFLIKLNRTHLLLLYEVSRMWSNMAFIKGEVAYDDYMDVFERMLEYARGVDTSHGDDPDDSTRAIKFVFDTGFLPILYFLVSKCRDLRKRLDALSYIKKYGTPRENVWEVLPTFHLCRRIIEIEHDIVLDSRGKPLTGIPSKLPPDSMRVREAWTSSKPTKQIREGQVVTGRTVAFLLPTPEGGTKKVREFLCDDLKDLVADSFKYYHKRRAEKDDV